MNPFLMWSRVGWNAIEMAIGSMRVITQRTSRIALAGPFPAVRDQREFALMGEEKIAAAVESAQAVGRRMLTMNQQLVALAIKQMLSASTGMMLVAGSRNLGESVGHQAKLVSDTVSGSVAAASKLSGSTASLARTALKPVHKRVSSNVRRLNRR